MHFSTSDSVSWGWLALADAARLQRCAALLKVGLDHERRVG